MMNSCPEFCMSLDTSQEASVPGKMTATRYKWTAACGAILRVVFIQVGFLLKTAHFRIGKTDMMTKDMAVKVGVWFSSRID